MLTVRKGYNERMRDKKIFGWLSLDIIIFIAINALVISFYGDKIFGIFQVDLFRLLVLGLAAYRLANIISNEVVAKPLRAPFVDEVRREGKIVEKPKSSGFLGAIGLLIYCPSCTGVWVAAALVYSYVFWTGPTLIIAFILALSAVERITASIVGFFKQRS